MAGLTHQSLPQPALASRTPRLAAGRVSGKKKKKRQVRPLRVSWGKGEVDSSCGGELAGIPLGWGQGPESQQPCREGRACGDLRLWVAEGETTRSLRAGNCGEGETQDSLLGEKGPTPPSHSS